MYCGDILTNSVNSCFDLRTSLTKEPSENYFVDAVVPSFRRVSISINLVESSMSVYL